MERSEFEAVLKACEGIDKNKRFSTLNKEGNDVTN
jgi:hypothetical protein